MAFEEKKTDECQGDDRTDIEASTYLPSSRLRIAVDANQAQTNHVRLEYGLKQRTADLFTQVDLNWPDNPLPVDRFTL